MKHYFAAANRGLILAGIVLLTLSLGILARDTARASQYGWW